MVAKLSYAASRRCRQAVCAPGEKVYFPGGEMMIEDEPKYWYSRGYLPHFDNNRTMQFITFRLADSLPQNVLDKWRIELAKDEITDADFRRRIEYYLDQNYGECHLKKEKVALIVEENILRFDGEKYKLHTWVIMPNHVHLLLTPLKNLALGKITQGCKSYTANEVNKLLGRSGRFWYPESFDRYIRDEKHFANTFEYIENNPVKASLCKIKNDWRFSAAHHRKTELYSFGSR